MPTHAPVQTHFGVVGECRWTPLCDMAMRHFYAQPINKGAKFDWPDGRIVGICPGTGERVAPTDDRGSDAIVILVACQMQGTIIRGADVQMLTRIMPRVLTVKGYRQLMGPEDDPGYMGNITSKRVRVVEATGKPVGNPELVTRPFYPDVLREITSAQRSASSSGGGDGGGGSGGKKNNNGKAKSGSAGEKIKVPTANKLWETFHDEGTYLAFERLLEDKLGGAMASYGGHQGPIRGPQGGPSTYTMPTGGSSPWRGK